MFAVRYRSRLEPLGHEVIVFTPCYRGCYDKGVTIEPTGIELQIPIADRIVTGTLVQNPIAGQ